MDGPLTIYYLRWLQAIQQIRNEILVSENLFPVRASLKTWAYGSKHSVEINYALPVEVRSAEKDSEGEAWEVMRVHYCC